MSTNTGLLIESCNFKILTITINDIEIQPNYISDLSVDWNGEFRIYGYVTINDHFDLVNTMLKTPGQRMEIKIIDNYDAVFIREFVITNSGEVKEQDFKTIQLRFQDSISYVLQNTFIAKSYKETTLVDVLNDYLKLEAKPSMDEYKIKVLSKPTRKLSNFVVPLHIDFLTFIENEFEREGVFFYQTRNYVVIGDDDIPEMFRSDELPYVQVGKTDLYGFKMLEYKLQFNNIRRTMSLQKSNVMAYNPNTKSMVSYDSHLGDFMEDMNTGGVVKNSQLTNGTQYKTKSTMIDTQKYHHLDYKYNTEMNIIVPGNLEYSLLWKQVIAKVSGSQMSVETRESGDVVLSGEYQISRVEDKFLVGQKFVQRLTLRRINEGKQ
jgi:hypothetical protein